MRVLCVCARVCAPLLRGGARLTSDARGCVGGDVGVHRDLGVQDAPVGVGVHLEGVQQLAVVLHPVVVGAALLGDQPGAVCWAGGGRPVRAWGVVCYLSLLLLWACPWL